MRMLRQLTLSQTVRWFNQRIYFAIAMSRESASKYSATAQMVGFDVLHQRVALSLILF
jgi:hypothetical protein